jgi:hypothetical protein
MEDNNANAFSELAAHNVRALWTAPVNAVTRAPPGVPLRRAVPTIWRYQTIRAELIRAGATVSVEEAERRVLVLVNPGHRRRRARLPIHRSFSDFNWYFREKQHLVTGTRRGRADLSLMGVALLPWLMESGSEWSRAI